MKNVLKRLVQGIIGSLIGVSIICLSSIKVHAETYTGTLDTLFVVGNSGEESYYIPANITYEYTTSVPGGLAMGDTSYIENGLFTFHLDFYGVYDSSRYGTVTYDFVLEGLRYTGTSPLEAESSADLVAFINLTSGVPEVAHCLMYRLYNPNSGEHFYTGSTEELEHLKSIGWTHEGNGFEVPVLSDTPVYRLYNPNAGDHHYTTSEAEKNILENAGWNYEGIAWYSAPDTCNPLYRLNNPNATSGAHHFTMSEEERDNLVHAGWTLEGIGWYGY